MLKIKEIEVLIEVKLSFFIELSPQKAKTGESKNIKSVPTIERDTGA